MNQVSDAALDRGADALGRVGMGRDLDSARLTGLDDLADCLRWGTAGRVDSMSA